MGEGSCEIGTPPREGISKDLGKILQFPRVSHKGFLQKHYQSGQITTTLRKPELTAIKLGGDSLTSDQPEDTDSSNLGIFWVRIWAACLWRKCIFFELHQSWRVEIVFICLVLGSGSWKLWSSKVKCLFLSFQNSNNNAKNTTISFKTTSTNWDGKSSKCWIFFVCFVCYVSQDEPHTKSWTHPAMAATPPWLTRPPTRDNLYAVPFVWQISI